MILEELTTRELQTECARALATMAATNHNIHQFNKQAHHNSHNWYTAVIKWYVDQYGDIPSKTGPGKEIKLILEMEQK